MLGSIGRSPTSDELPTLLAWQRQLMMRGGRAINHLLIGPGMHGQGSDWSSCYVNPASFHEVTNLAGFSYDTVKQSMERVDYDTSLPDVLRAQLALDATGDLCIETDVSKVFLVTASSDAGACAPKLEVDTARLQLVGSALGPITYEELEAKISDGSAPEIARSSTHPCWRSSYSLWPPKAVAPFTNVWRRWDRLPGAGQLRWVRDTTRFCLRSKHAACASRRRLKPAGYPSASAVALGMRATSPSRQETLALFASAAAAVGSSRRIQWSALG